MRAQEFIIEYKISARKHRKGVTVVATDDKGKQIGIAELEYHLPGVPEYEKTIQATRLFVEPKYQRQGIAQAMYDLLKSRGYKIFRSGDQSFDGAKFWNKHRGKNVRVWEQEFIEDSEEYGGIQLRLDIEKDDEYVDDDDVENQVIVVRAHSNGRELGQVLFTMDYDSQGLVLNPQDLEVDERYRGQGIAQTMYDFVKSKGYRIRRSGQQTDAGAGFWAKHRPEQNVWENFADGKKPGRKGLSKRVGIPKKATLGQLEKIAKSSTGEKRRMAQWQLNMRRGRAKKNK
jgi:GNAT superfamily N-acetyltransferase